MPNTLDLFQCMVLLSFDLSKYFWTPLLLAYTTFHKNQAHKNIRQCKKIASCCCCFSITFPSIDFECEGNLAIHLFIHLFIQELFTEYFMLGTILDIKIRYSPCSHSEKMERKILRK